MISYPLVAVVCRLWASHLREWVEGWLPGSVLSLGNGSSSVEAWFSTALDIEEVLSGTGGDQLHGICCCPVCPVVSSSGVSA